MVSRFEKYTNEYKRRLLTGYNKINLEEDNVDYKVNAWKYALYPVWILTYNYRDKIYVYAVNGQTGKACGELPIDNKKLSITSIIISIIIFIIIIAMGYLLW